jgi:hypothetical protein
MITEESAINIFGFIIFILVVYFVLRPFIKSKIMINAWAENNDLTIIKKELRLFFTGPFFNTSNRAIHRLEVRDKTGNIKVCWTRTGSLFGLNPNEFTVECED